ncbi:hypothetical protein UCI_00446 [Enterococcus faecalis EnGen0241]|nr:hypothetical protein UCI_00446 [Enterococcus faecalis EnGen0241]EOI37747.1 hypothetical protein UIU_02391 [Enterococcus faecalis EnGen0299]ERT21235.1 hypothetical protein O994_02377 [Enterococcus faecalis JH2-2]
MQQNYNEKSIQHNLMPTAKKYYETKLRLFENETLT